MRVIVTGSRTWKNGLFIREKLSMCLETAQRADDNLTIVHGACKSGADSYADAWARWHTRNNDTVTVTSEPHPANWEGPCIAQCQPNHRRMDPRGWDVCPAAGFYRNEKMVQLGADLVIAFIADESKGATHCARLAEARGLNVIYFRIGAGADVLF